MSVTITNNMTRPYKFAGIRLVPGQTTTVTDEAAITELHRNRILKAHIQAGDLTVKGLDQSAPVGDGDRDQVAEIERLKAEKAAAEAKAKAAELAKAAESGKGDGKKEGR